MSELRVPTVALAAQVVCADGRTFRGRVFVSTAASHHSGPLRAEEWMNEPEAFFPFLPDDTNTPMILNKREVLVLSVPAAADLGDLPEDAASPQQKVTLECEDHRLHGSILIDMPQNRPRLLDYLNRPGSFLTLRDGERHHLVQKERITRVLETREE